MVEISIGARCPNPQTGIRIEAWPYNLGKQESPPNDWAVQNATTLVPERLSSILLCYRLSRKRVWTQIRFIYSYARLQRENNTKIATYVIHKPTSGPFKPRFRDQRAEMSNSSSEWKWSTWITPSKTFNLFRNRLNRCREVDTRTWPKMNTFMRFAANRK